MASKTPFLVRLCHVSTQIVFLVTRKIVRPFVTYMKKEKKKGDKTFVTLL